MAHAKLPLTGPSPVRSATPGPIAPPAGTDGAGRHDRRGPTVDPGELASRSGEYGARRGAGA
ncbi:hypothetical protein QR97_28675 [Streptomyces sp. PBH53]|nr:hypothetical protein QR97_28675 [Streptomyces sp. PBH53]